MLENAQDSKDEYSMDEFLLSVHDSVISHNSEYFLQLKELKEDIMVSEQFFKLTYASMLCEDINFFLMTKENSFITKRHAECVLRNLVEQVIEFKYLIKNPAMREEFAGKDDYTSTGNPVEDLCQLNSGRFKSGRTSVSQMAKDLNEKNDTDEKLSLYSIYRILSEQMHNANFHEMLYDVGIVEGEKETSFLEENELYLNVLLTSFMETYFE